MRSDRLVPVLAISYYVAMLIFMTYPGYVPFSRVRPFVLGMPFALFWQVLWVSGAVAVLMGLYIWETRRAAGGGPRSGSGTSGPGAGGTPDARSPEAGRRTSSAEGGAE